MGTDLLSRLEKQAVQAVTRQVGVQEAWIAGGCLNRKDSKDIDVVVLTTHSFDFDDSFVFGNQNMMKVTGRYNQYSPEDGGKDMVVKLAPLPEYAKCRPIDLLVTSERLFKGSISKYMETYFPLSIQRKAISVATGITVDNSDADSPYIFVSEWANEGAEYVQKYFDYYPFKTFYKIRQIVELKKEKFYDIPF